MLKELQNIYLRLYELYESLSKSAKNYCDNGKPTVRAESTISFYKRLKLNLICNHYPIEKKKYLNEINIYS